jgi:catechol 2,3-dioxygenase-like lactoylglutathione lyase family enzyme
MDAHIRICEGQPMDTRLEVVVLPVSDVDRAAQFYMALGWRLDADISPQAGYRIVQVTPPGSPASIIFGAGVSTAVPGSVQGLQMVVADIEAARADLVGRGVEVSEVFHDETGIFHHAGTDKRVPGPDPERRSYASFVSFSDPDGNGWVLQEITARLPGRVDAATTSYASADDLADAMRRAAAAHGEHEKRIGEADENWPAWYARYMVAEQAGAELPL